MAKAYRIAGWNELYENNKSREVEMLTYFLHPNKLVGEGLGFLKQQPDWLELYGIFTFFKMLASHSPRLYRGWLVRSGSPLDAPRISALTGIESKKAAHALEFFSTPPMDWLVLEEMPQYGRSTGGGQRVDTSSAPVGQHKGTISPGLRTDIGLTEGKREREEEGEVQGPKSKVQSQPDREGQVKQFAAAGARVAELEAIDPEQRSPEQERELKKMRGVRKEIQKKQARGDFSVVKDEVAA